jgi:cobalt-zinc-cadmium efflux system outer membrane protein
MSTVNAVDTKSTVHRANPVDSVFWDRGRRKGRAQKGRDAWWIPWKEWRAMSQHPGSGRRIMAGSTTVLGFLILAAAGARGQEPTTKPAQDSITQVLTREVAIARALQSNPELAVLRQQHGIAAGAVVIADTYPFNPSWTNKIFGASGPASAGITNSVATEQRVAIDFEWNHQGRYRRQAASAGMSRVDFEIAFSELSMAVRTGKAFDAVLYRYQKVQLADETVKLTKEAAEKIAKLADLPDGKITPADAILARSELYDAQAQTGQARSAYAAAWAQLNAALGVTTERFLVHGSLAEAAVKRDADGLTSQALELRPDLRAKQAAVGEAEARLQLEIRNRFGNPNFGPDYERNETSVDFYGFQLVVPLPVLNRKRGEILQRQAERDRTLLALRQNETVIRQDVQAAVRRLEEAEAWVETYRTKVLPDLKSSLQSLEELFDQNRPGADVLRLITVRRKLLTARGGYLDALYEAGQARADLAAAVGDPTVGTNTETPSPKP